MRHVLPFARRRIHILPRPKPPLKPAALLAIQFKETLVPYELSHKYSFTLLSKHVDDFVKVIEESQDRVTAFDMEWNTSTRVGVERRVGLIQVAHAQAGILLYSVPRSVTASLPDSLVRYLRNPEIYKLGVQIRGDALKLSRDFPALPTLEGSIDLNAIAKTVEPDRWKNDPNLVSLQRLAAEYLDRYLSKGSVRRSNFEGLQVRPDALQYAAKDVQVTLDIYQQLAKIAEDTGRTLDLALLRSHSTTSGSDGISTKVKAVWQAFLDSPEDQINEIFIASAGDRFRLTNRSILIYILLMLEKRPTAFDEVSPALAARLHRLCEDHKIFKFDLVRRKLAAKTQSVPSIFSRQDL